MILEQHVGIVTNVDDPDQRGRIKVKCQTLVGADQELPVWVEPAVLYSTKSGAGFWWIPEIDSEVELEIMTGDDSTDESPGESFLAHPELRYRAGRFGVTNPAPEGLKGTDPKKLGIRSPDGHTLVFETEKITLSHNSGSKIVMSNDGNITISAKAGGTVTIDDGSALAKAVAFFLHFSTHVSLYNTHPHIAPPFGGTTSGPTPPDPMTGYAASTVALVK